MKTTTNNGKRVNIYLHILGYAFCIVPPLVCTLTFFPIWESTSGFKLNALCAIVIILAIFPIIKLLRRLLKSDASYIFWLILFICFFAMSRIADEMTVISFIGFISNSIGAILMRLGGKRNGRKTEA